MQLPEQPGWLQDINSMLVSASVHLTLLIVLGLLTVAGSGGGRGEKLVMSLGGNHAEESDSGDALSADIAPIEDSSAAAVAADDLAAAFGPASEMEMSTPLATDVAPPDAIPAKSAEVSGGAAGSIGDTAGMSMEEMAAAIDKSLGGTSGKARGGGGNGDGGSTKAATEFFGIGGSGQTFVYVVDGSDSMNENGKFERARYELLHSIEQLGKDQRYYVIFYNDKAYPMDADKPLLATQDNLAQTTNWINRVEPGGGTNPLPALVFALSLRPDAIYFLSDGQFDPATIQQLRSRNRQNLRLQMRQIPIHTIAFFDRFAEGLMRTIARNSGGEYRFVK